jgi:hypothetical protein
MQCFANPTVEEIIDQDSHEFEKELPPSSNFPAINSDNPAVVILPNIHPHLCSDGDDSDTDSLPGLHTHLHSNSKRWPVPENTDALFAKHQFNPSQVNSTSAEVESVPTVHNHPQQRCVTTSQYKPQEFNAFSTSHTSSLETNAAHQAHTLQYDNNLCDHNIEAYMCSAFLAEVSVESDGHLKWQVEMYKYKFLVENRYGTFPSPLKSLRWQEAGPQSLRTCDARIY